VADNKHRAKTARKSLGYHIIRAKQPDNEQLGPVGVIVFDMKKTAVFMGAGASKPFGFPLTCELLPLMQEKLNSGELFRRSQSAREELSRYITRLLPGFNSVAPENLPLITDVLSLVDHSLFSSNSLTPLMARRDLARLRILLEWAILEVLDLELLPLPHIVPTSLARLTDWLFAQTRMDGHSVGVISTNYDIALETQLFRRYSDHLIRTEFDFGFSWRDTSTGTVYERPANPSFRLYKLHGSLNWLRCDLCDHVYINIYGSIADLSFTEGVHSNNTCHCNYAPLRSVIIAPSLVRDIRDVNLLECWKNAIEFLRTASEWIIIGYSFPPEDIAIRSLFLRAYNGRESPPEIRIVQKGESRDVISRYKLFFPNCIYDTDGLEGFLAREYTPTGT